MVVHKARTGGVGGVVAGMMKFKTRVNAYGVPSELLGEVQFVGVCPVEIGGVLPAGLSDRLAVQHPGQCLTGIVQTSVMVLVLDPEHA